MASEARALVVAYPTTPRQLYIELPRQKWPATIASLHPEKVTIYPWGVDVRMKAYFDGGWGYQIAKRRRDLPMLDQCYSEVSQGVFWHGPC